MNAFSAEINRVVEDVRRHYLVPGLAIAVVRGGDAVHVQAYGLRNTAGYAAADIDTAFAIGSCSKAFTCALAAALVDDHRLGWDDRVRTYLPGFQLHDPWISDHLTIRDLLANRTGLSRASVGEYGSDLSRPDLLQRARFIPPICGFRDQFTYNNVGYAAAAEAMAELSGRTFDQLMDQHVRQVLQMTASKAGSPSSSEDNIAAPHYLINGVVQPVPPMSTDNLVGALGQVLSARDAARWLAFHLGESSRKTSIGETHLLQIVRRNRIFNEGYGLGWHVRNRRIQHDGVQRGFRANVWCDLDGGIGIFVGMNLGYSSAHVAITNHIIQLCRGETPIDWIAELEQLRQQEHKDRVALFDQERRETPISTSPLILDDFTGTFRHPGFGRLHIDSRGDHLWFRIDDLSGFDGPLVRYSALSFEYQGDRDAVAWPPLAIPQEPRGDRARIRFRLTTDGIEGLDWFDWFGAAQFVRDEAQ
jgi:CubicO group peptidase (beta-lactamase class C family)